MNSKPSYAELEAKLRTLESVIHAIQNGEVDAIVRGQELSMVRSKRSLDETQERLWDSEARYRAIVEDQTEMICRFLPNGNLSFVNQAFCNYFQKTHQELLSRPFHLLTSDGLSIFDNAFISDLSTSNPVVTLDHSILLHGELRWNQWTIHLIYDHQGNPKEYQAVGRDTTDTKQAEIALKQAKEMAEAANLAKSQFLANISHDLRTPLHAIIGYTQILKERFNDSKDKKILNTLYDSANHLLTLIDEILDFSKIEMHKMELMQNLFLFTPFLHTILNIAEIQAQAKGLKVIHQFSSELPNQVKGDEKKLRQVLLNLLTNAIRYTVTGHVALNVDEFRDKIRFQVIDSGIGIPEDKLEKIFEPFCQLPMQSQKNEGIGLGLAISRKLVRLMGSDLFVQSQLNEGSRFWFDLDMFEKTTQIIHDANTATYQKNIVETHDKNLVTKNNNLVLLDKHELGLLYEFAISGDVFALRSMIDHIKSSVNKPVDLLEKIEHLVNTYRLDEIQQLLESWSLKKT
ncbi:MAG: PAS domain S-box protein [Desulfobacterales bacterium]|nr:PAS domain S-box protein [Desulfobacterales bacterium]